MERRDNRKKQDTHLERPAGPKAVRIQDEYSKESYAC
jgi:hypothetical protein